MMVQRWALLGILCLGQFATAATNSDLVNLAKVDISIKQNLCVVRKPVADALSRVQNSLKLIGRGLRVLSCYLPEAAPPLKLTTKPPGMDNASHTRGGSVDITMVGSNGEEMLLPDALAGGPQSITPGSKIDRDRVAKKNLARLSKAMESEGFTSSPPGWWHFNFKDWEKFESAKVPLSDFE